MGVMRCTLFSKRITRGVVRHHGMVMHARVIVHGRLILRGDG